MSEKRDRKRCGIKDAGHFFGTAIFLKRFPALLQWGRSLIKTEALVICRRDKRMTPAR